MLPRVILHNAFGLDGKVDGFPIDLQQYYELASIWKEDATLAGPNTILKGAYDAPPEDDCALLPPSVDPDDRRPILAVPDSRVRIRTWHYLRSLSYWRDFVALCSKSTPKEYLNYLKERHIDYIISGEDHVDLLAAFMQLNERYAVEVVRVDAGGTHNGLLPGSGPGRRGERADLSHHGDGEERHLQSTKTTPGPIHRMVQKMRSRLTS